MVPEKVYLRGNGVRELVDVNLIMDILFGLDERFNVKQEIVDFNFNKGLSIDFELFTNCNSPADGEEDLFSNGEYVDVEIKVRHYFKE